MDVTCEQLKQELSQVQTNFEDFSLSINTISFTEGLDKLIDKQLILTSSVEELENLLETYTVELKRELAQKLGLDHIEKFFRGIAKVKKDNEEFFINTKGEQIGTEKYDYTSYFEEEIAYVVKNNKYF